SKAATFCVNGGRAGNSGAKRRELSVVEERIFWETQTPATPAEPASRNFLRCMLPSRFLLYRPVRRGWGGVGYRGPFVANPDLVRRPSCARLGQPGAAVPTRSLLAGFAVGTRAGAPAPHGHVRYFNLWCCRILLLGWGTIPSQI